MTFTRLLHTLALVLMQGEFPGAATQTMTRKEGEDLTLHCTFSSDNTSALQWLNPHGFTIFLNTQQVLRDQRYKLIHYSKDELSIQLSNLTVHDEGQYKCFQYSKQFKSKTQTVQIFAAPSNPVLKVSQDTQRGITLSCYTQGCRPQPHITWLLDNGIELPGDTRHKLEADGKKWSTTSTLTVLAYRPKATASCIIHHPALREEKLVASFQFEDLPSTGSKQPTSPSATAEEPAGTIPPAEEPALTTSVPTPTQQNFSFTPDVTSSWSGITSTAAGKEELGSSWSYDEPIGTEPAFPGNATEEELPSTETSQPQGNVTVISIEQDPKSKGIIKKEKNLLLPMLVAALILVLLIIILLFMRKLKKAHGVWKRENDASEQTLESYKSKSNEDNAGQEKNGHVANHKSNLQYVTERYVETTQKNPSDKSIAASEKVFGCGKETDV